MKKDLTLALFVAVLGTLIAYYVTNIFIPEIKPVSVTTVDATVLSAELATPDEKVFNYLAINPTVEVYVGSCAERDVNGNCLVEDNRRAEILQDDKKEKEPQCTEDEGFYDENDEFHCYSELEDYDEDLEDEDDEEEEYSYRSSRNSLFGGE